MLTTSLLFLNTSTRWRLNTAWVIGGGESIGDALLIPNPVPAVHRLPVNGISGDTEYRVRFCDQRDIVPTRTVTG